MYSQQIIKHVTKTMQLKDGDKVVFKANVDVAVDDYINNVPALQKAIGEVMAKQEHLRGELAEMTNVEALQAMQALAEFSNDMQNYIKVFLTTVLGAENAHRLLNVCGGRYLDAYVSTLPFVDECIAPAINKELEKNVARIENIMK